MMLNEITVRAGAYKRRKRVGRGDGSGKGKTCGRGHKGCQSRSGGGVRPLTEGGQMPFFRRMPKRGFSNFQFRDEFEIVNVGALDQRFRDGDTVDTDVLRKLRLVHGRKPRVRILGRGQLDKKLTVTAHAFSHKAKEAIEKAGGTANLIEQKTRAEKGAAKRLSAKGKRATQADQPGGEAGTQESQPGS